MKKFLSVVLVLTMIFSLCGSFTVFATEEEPAVAEEIVEPVTEEVTEEAAEEPAEAAAEEPAEEPAEESEEGTTEEPVEEPTEEISEEPTEEPGEEPAEDGAEPTVFVLDTLGDGVVVIQYVAGGTPGDGSIVAKKIANLNVADASMKWTADSGAYSLDDAGTTVYLYYDDTNLKVTTTTQSGKNKWTYTPGTIGTVIGSAEGVGTLYYNGKTKYTVSSYTLDGDIMFTKGSDSGSSSSSGDGVTYTKITSLSTKYIAIANKKDKLAFKLDQGQGTTAVTIDGDNLTAVKGVCIQVDKVGNDYTLQIEDPPDTLNYIYCDGGTFATVAASGATAADYAHWNMDGDGLYYMDGSTKYYFSDAAGAFSTTKNKDIKVYGGDSKASGGGSSSGDSDTSDTLAPTFSKQPGLVNGTPGQSVAYSKQDLALEHTFDICAEATAPEGYDVSVTYTWYCSVNNADYTLVGEEHGTTIHDTIDLGENGFYTYYCTATCSILEEGATEPTDHTATSDKFVITIVNGTDENLFFTFSDVHQSFDHILNLYYNVLTTNEYKLPNLIIATGDWHNGHGSVSTKDTDADIESVLLRSLNVTTVLVAGNHENNDAVTEYQKKLADEDNTGTVENYKNETEVGAAYYKGEEGKGIIYESDNLIVIGINFDEQKSGYGTTEEATSLTSIVKKILDDVATSPIRSKRAIVIAAHAGLHVVQGSSKYPQDYNIANAYDFANMLNAEAEKGLDITFGFGHNHSKGEKSKEINAVAYSSTKVDFVKKWNSETVKPDSEEMFVKFNYTHLGFIGSSGDNTGSYGVISEEGGASKVETKLVQNCNSTNDVVLPTAVNQVDNELKAAASEDDLKALFETIFSQEELEQKRDGKDTTKAVLTFKASELAEDDAADVKKVEKFLRRNHLNPNCSFVSLTLWKDFEGEETQVSETAKEVTFTLEVPVELREADEGFIREFYLLRVHDGRVSLIPCAYADGLLTAASDKFSTYAIAFKDVKVYEKDEKQDTKPAADDSSKDDVKDSTKGAAKDGAKNAPAKTGDESTPVIWAVCVLAAGAVLVALPRKKHN